MSPSVVTPDESVHIFVLNAKTGQRVENATAIVGNKKLETYYPGQTGFISEEVGVGEFTVTVAKRNTTSTRYINDTAELSVVSEVPGGTAGETSVELVPANQTVTGEKTVPFDVVVTDASGGVGEWNISVRIRDANVTSHTELTALVTEVIEIPPHLVGSTSIHYSGNVYSDRPGYARSIAGTYEGANTANSGRVTVVRFIVSGQTSGTVPVTLTVDELRDENGNSYEVIATENATLTVEQRALDVTRDGNPARDPDGDGLYEDVNGDGDVTPGDATVLFDAVFEGNATVTENVSLFDFNSDGSVTPGDATILFNEIF